MNTFLMDLDNKRVEPIFCNFDIQLGFDIHEVKMERLFYP